MHLGIFYNTYAANGKGLIIADKIIHFCKKENIAFSAVKNAWDISQANFTCIALIGGDGSLNYFINQFPKLNIPVILFAGGTGNDFYWNIYKENGITEQLELLKNILVQQEKYFDVDVASCIIQNNEKKYFINSVGLGFDGEVLKSMDTIRYFGGHLGYMFVVLKKIFSFKEPKYKLQIDDEEEKNWQAITICNIANAPRTGGGFLISPEANVHDNVLNLLYCNIPNRLKRLRYFSLVKSAKHIFSKEINYAKIKKIKIQAEIKIGAQIDGEFMESDVFEIALENWKWRLVV